MQIQILSQVLLTTAVSPTVEPMKENGRKGSRSTLIGKGKKALQNKGQRNRKKKRTTIESETRKDSVE